ncbi:RagB/SusD family nutrient uptake outer membrane protein, partial [Parapusillimonas sp. SGNA-6]|nr:RagB/SusD family nutrient uptake outer membrane protein [Parapusillimonas sp. SGNA-6]
WELGQLYQRYCGKWRRTYELILPRSTTRTATNFPLLRYSDVLLMFAEAENEVNGSPTEEAYEAINQVKRRAYGYDQFTPNTDIDEDDLSYQEFLEYIQDERSRELAFEGLRKSDLVRWGIYVRNMQYIAQDVAPLSGDFYDFPRRTFGSVTERHTLWPIPTYEMGLNPHLVQNPGW